MIVRHRLYDLAILSYILAFGHFGSELLVFRTAGLGAPLLSPVVVSSEFTSPGRNNYVLTVFVPFSSPRYQVFP